MVLVDLKLKQFRIKFVLFTCLSNVFCNRTLSVEGAMNLVEIKEWKMRWIGNIDEIYDLAIITTSTS